MIHTAKAVEPWLAQHPRVVRRCLAADYPRATPIARCFGGVHDLCIRKHRYTRVGHRLADVKADLHRNGPWKYKLSQVYDELEVPATVDNMIQAGRLTTAV